MVVVEGQADLLEVVGALDPPRRLARRLHGRQEQRDQHRDDGDDDQQLDQREARSSLIASSMLIDRILQGNAGLWSSKSAFARFSL